MSSSDSQPPLTRRQARERERASERGSQPVAPPAADVVNPASASAETPRRRPGSHAAPAGTAPAQSAAARPQPVDALPASATEIVPGTGGLTRRQLRALREAQSQAAAHPVPLQAPGPQSSDRSVADVLGTVTAIEGQQESEGATTADRDAAVSDAGVSDAAVSDAGVSDAAAMEQAVAADGSPAAVEPLADAIAHSEEPHRRRSTWTPAPALGGAPAGPIEPALPVSGSSPHSADDAAAVAARTDISDASGASTEHSTSRDLTPTEEVDAAAVAIADDVVTSAGEADDESRPAPVRLPLPSELPSPRDPAVFPIELGIDAVGTDAEPGDDADANADGADADAADPADDAAGTRDGDAAASAVSAARLTKRAPAAPVSVPAGHWSRQAAGEGERVRDRETGETRWTETQANALVMPTATLSDVTGALNATGEVILTGSIDLPKTLAATGAHTRIDGADVDRLLEQHDADSPDADATPVRASSAVSSHTSTRQVVLAAAKPKQSGMPAVLAVAAASFGVIAVAALVVAGFALHLF